MRARTAIAWTSHRVRRTAVGWGLTTMLACVALSACTSSPASTPPPSTFIPSAGASVHRDRHRQRRHRATASASEREHERERPRASTSVSTSVSPSASRARARSLASPSPSPSPSPVPDGAPVTGGGGTAGFQDAGLAVLGGAAIVAGLGGIAYRRRITKHR